MRGFTVGLIVGIAVSLVVTVKAQAPLSVPDCENPPELRASIHCPNVHEHDLTMKEVIQILAEVDVRHAAQQPFFQPAYGATTFGTNPPQMWIFDGATITDKSSTVIHELIHAHCHFVAVECTEEYVASEEVRQYQKIFGVQ